MFDFVKHINIFFGFTNLLKKRCKTLIINPTFFIEGAKIGVF